MQYCVLKKKKKHECLSTMGTRSPYPLPEIMELSAYSEQDYWALNIYTVFPKSSIVRQIYTIEDRIYHGYGNWLLQQLSRWLVSEDRSAAHRISTYSQRAKAEEETRSPWLTVDIWSGYTKSFTITGNITFALRFLFFICSSYFLTCQVCGVLTVFRVSFPTPLLPPFFCPFPPLCLQIGGFARFPSSPVWGSSLVHLNAAWETRSPASFRCHYWNITRSDRQTQTHKSHTFIPCPTQQANTCTPHQAVYWQQRFTHMLYK